VQELIYTARRVRGTEAVRLGLADHCVEEGKAMERALELAREIAQVRAGDSVDAFATQKPMMLRVGHAAES
jgi:enoyl-CoA hydratase/carnithine racemase